MPRKPTTLLRARKSFSRPGHRRFHQGDLVRSDDPAVKGVEDLFEDVLEKFGIEQATKNPGQKRAAKKPDVAKQVETPEAVPADEDE